MIPDGDGAGVSRSGLRPLGLDADRHWGCSKNTFLRNWYVMKLGVADIQGELFKASRGCEKRGMFLKSFTAQQGYHEDANIHGNLR